VVAAFLFNEVPRPLQALGIAMVVVGVIMLSANRDWLGTRWHLGRSCCRSE
jgi:drug/metabolite transporter (DMT)-like permease